MNTVLLNLIFLQITFPSSFSLFAVLTTHNMLQNIVNNYNSASLIYPDTFPNVLSKSRIGSTILDAAINQIGSTEEVQLYSGQSIGTSMMELKYLPLENLACVDDFEEVASQKLNRDAYFYFHDGSGQQRTKINNKLAYEKIILKPRVLVGVENRRLDKKIFGKTVSFPFGTSPTALQQLATTEGELANARASEAMGTIFTLSVMSNAKLEDVAKAAPNGRNWANVYIFKNRSLTENIIKRAENNGFEAIVVTIDSPVCGLKRQHVRVPFVLSPNITITKLRVIVKGIMSPEDADLAVVYEVDGLVVSNHGGRQLDSVSPTIDILPEIVRRVAGRCLVIVEGGVTSGQDIFKALALGADMVFAGRPLVWGLAVGGEQGAKRVLQLLKDEFNQTMALSGVRTVQQITDYYVERSVLPLQSY